MGDVIAGLDPGAVGRRVLGRGDHLDRPILGRNGQAEAAVIAFGGGLELGEVGRLGIARMRVERRQHAVDRALDQRMVVDLVDIVGADPLEHAEEGLQFLLRVGLGRGEGGRRDRDHRQRADQREGWEKLGKALHHLNSCLCVASQFSGCCRHLTAEQMKLR